MQDASSLRGDTVIQTLVNMSSEECRDDTATKTIGNIVGHDVPNDLNRAILDIVGAPDDILGDTVVETIANMVHSYDSSAEVPDNVIDALVMLNEVSGGEPYSDGRNLFAVSTASDGYIGAHGGYNAAVNENHPLTSAFIPVKPGQSLVFQAWSLVTSNGTGSGNGNIWLAYCFYDSSKAAVGNRSDKYGGTILESGRAYSSYDITVPDGAAYIRVTYRRVLGGFAKLEYGEDATDWTPAPQDVEVVINEAYDCFANDAALIPPLRMTVFGKSVQDGTPTPNAPVAIQSVEGNLLSHPYQFFNSSAARGVTYTQNADGSITAQGTASGLAYLQLCRRDDNWLNLVPGETYMIVAHSSNVCAMNTANSSTTSNAGQVTIPTDGSNWGIGIAVQSGKTIDETFNVDLFHVYAPVTDHVPYGCVGLSAMGGNLLGRSQLALNKTVYGITVTDGGNGWIDVAGTFSGSSAAIVRFSGPLSDTGTYIPEFRRGGRMSLYVEDEGGVLDSNVRVQVASLDASNNRVYNYADGAGLVKFDAAENGLTYICLHLKSAASGRVLSGRIRLTLVYGDHNLTGYVPPEVTVTPVPLAGHVLRSLPDGTRDFVTVGQDGRVTLTQQVGELTIDGTEKWSASSIDGIVYSVLSSARLGSYLNDALCDRFAGSFKVLASMADPSFKIGKTSDGTRELLYIKSTSLMTSVADFKAWLTNNPTTIIYPLAEPVTYDLGYIDVPSLPSPEFSVSVVAGVQPTMTMRYIRN